MGQPAARIGDTTVHGGAITVGCPTVLIGGMPAARMGDMHVCPMVTPATPPIPHVGGPIVKGSTGVLIGGMPAARMGDLAVCTGPPDSIILGCMTVLIGETMAGGAGGGAGAGAGAGGGSAVIGAITSARIAGGDTQAATVDTHSLDISIQDKEGKPVGGVGYDLTGPGGTHESGVLGGRIKRNGVEAGSYSVALKGIFGAEWSRPAARAGEDMRMKVETAGIESGTPVHFEVWERNVKQPDRSVGMCEAEIRNDTAEGTWQWTFEEDPLPEDDLVRDERPPLYDPQCYFVVKAGGFEARSGMLGCRESIELHLEDEEGEPIKNTRFRVHLSNGEIREGTLDSGGCAKVDNVPPGGWSVEFPDYADVEDV